MDNSEQVVKQWIENLNISQENQGVTKTLNKMVGEYITLCASDDVLTAQS